MRQSAGIAGTRTEATHPPALPPPRGRSFDGVHEHHGQRLEWTEGDVSGNEDAQVEESSHGSGGGGAQARLYRLYAKGPEHWVVTLADYYGSGGALSLSLLWLGINPATRQLMSYRCNARGLAGGVGDNPQRLRELASLAWATADELGEARARQRHPGREWADCLTDSRQCGPRPDWAGVLS